jgi:hypothetical protein
LFAIDVTEPGIDFLAFGYLFEVSLALFLGDILAVKRALIQFTIDLKGE